MSDNWDKGLPSEGMKDKVDMKCHVSLLAWMAEIRSTIKVSFISYFVSKPESESESEPESESIRRLGSESEPESEQPHHYSTSLAEAIGEAVFFADFAKSFKISRDT